MGITNSRGAVCLPLLSSVSLLLYGKIKLGLSPVRPNIDGERGGFALRVSLRAWAAADSASNNVFVPVVVPALELAFEPTCEPTTGPPVGFPPVSVLPCVVPGRPEL
jgi:hypothetical protein